MRIFRTAATCAAAACLLAACSSSGGKGGPTTTPKNTGSGGSSTAAPPSTPPASSTGSGTTTASATAALLVAADVAGGTFAEQPYEPDDSPPPCDENGKPIDAIVPPAVAVGRDLVEQTPQAILEEEYKIYADEATAQQAMTAAKAALNCTTGKSKNDDGTTDTLTIAGPNDVTSAIGTQVDEAVDWSVNSTDVTGAAVAVRIKDRLVLLTFAAAAGTDTSTLPDVSAVVATAVQKVIAGS